MVACQKWRLFWVNHLQGCSQHWPIAKIHGCANDSPSSKTTNPGCTWKERNENYSTWRKKKLCAPKYTRIKPTYQKFYKKSSTNIKDPRKNNPLLPPHRATWTSLPPALWPAKGRISPRRPPPARKPGSFWSHKWWTKKGENRKINVRKAIHFKGYQPFFGKWFVHQGKSLKWCSRSMLITPKNHGNHWFLPPNALKNWRSAASARRRCSGSLTWCPLTPSAPFSK